MRERQSDQLGRYYTQQSVGDLLVTAMAVESPKTVIDLGSGSGILVRSAARVWKSARFLTVDIDSKAARLMGLPTDNVALKHHVGDALQYDLRERIGLVRAKACAGVCNPPYIRPKWRRHFGEILEDVGLSSMLPRAEDVPADVLFVAQNLRLLKEGGRLGIILPDGLVTGERFANFRRLLIERNAIQKAIELPVGIFSRTEAKAHVLILTKGACQQSEIYLSRLESDGALTDPLTVSPECARKRIDYAFHSQQLRSSNNTRKSSISVGSLVESICRGRHSSSMRRDSKLPIFHTTDFHHGAKAVPRRFAIDASIPLPKNIVLAMAGDILLARVGRNLSAKVCVVNSGLVPISDCIFALRPKKGCGSQLMDFLTSNEGRAALEAAAHGVGARFITASALRSIVI